MTTPVLPADTNTYGNIFGGHLVALIDKTASITAARHARQNVVTASIDGVDFHSPIRLGDIVTLRSRLNHVGRTSMEIEVEVTTESRTSEEQSHACSALLTFVAVDSAGKPVPVPRLETTCEEDRARAEAGRRRADQRKSGKE